jgi:hypothetical protein
MLSIRKKFANCCATKTGLAGARSGDLNQMAPGAFSVVRDLMEEGSPVDILHSRIFGHFVAGQVGQGGLALYAAALCCGFQPKISSNPLLP